MPQMAPTMWLFIAFISILVTFLNMNNIYFYKSNKSLKSKKSFFKKNNLWLW